MTFGQQFSAKPRIDIKKLWYQSLNCELAADARGREGTEIRRARARDRDPQINADERQEKFREKLYELAIDNFRLNLEKLRTFYPVKTICMHGSPLSKWDNRDLWKRYDYRDFGIIAEPYFDVDFGEVLYITDTGRSWNHSNASLRDKVNSQFDITIKDTNHLIEKIQNNELPDKIMINAHPQRWDDRFGPWVKELVWQNFKNVIKRLILKLRSQ